MKHHRLIQAILNLRPGAEVSIADNDSSQITVHDDTILPTEDELAAECARLDAQQNLLAEIHRLESEVTQRRLREATLGTDGGWLANQEALIAAERGKL